MRFAHFVIQKLSQTGLPITQIVRQGGILLKMWCLKQQVFRKKNQMNKKQAIIKERITAGISSNIYAQVHYWMYANFGLATRCESVTCNGKHKKYEWALVRGMKYEKKRENFIMLCISCHRKYDMTDRQRQKMREGKLGSKQTMETKLKRAKKHYKITEQYDLQGNFLNRFESRKDAIKATGALGNGIGAVIAGRQKTAGGFIWKNGK